MKVLNSSVASSHVRAQRTGRAFSSRAKKSSNPSLLNQTFISSSTGSVITLESLEDLEKKSLLKQILTVLGMLIATGLSLSFWGATLEKKLVREYFNELVETKPEIINNLKEAIKDANKAPIEDHNYVEDVLLLVPLCFNRGEMMFVKAAKDGRRPFLFKKEDGGYYILGINDRGEIKQRNIEGNELERFGGTLVFEGNNQPTQPNGFLSKSGLENSLRWLFGLGHLDLGSMATIPVSQRDLDRTVKNLDAKNARA